MDPSKIPPGPFCYRVLPVREGEVLSADIAQYGRGLREFAYGPGYKAMLCPYWQRTDHGTVKCLFVGAEVLDEAPGYPQSRALLAARIGRQAAESFPTCSTLEDEIKICGMREDEDDPRCESP